MQLLLFVSLNNEKKSLSSSTSDGETYIHRAYSKRKKKSEA